MRFPLQPIHKLASMEAQREQITRYLKMMEKFKNPKSWQKVLAIMAVVAVIAVIVNFIS